MALKYSLVIIFILTSICLYWFINQAGSDGLIKLWNYKKSICINTFEKHEGKIWSLDVFDNGKGK